ncbi:MAG: tetratricopeptide repeat protein [Anaerolineae bacterium]|nr:tetratricopeptide repeat protein [Anaerolineae bacterium]
MSFRIELLGSFVVEEDGRPSRIANSAKGCALLTYLIVSGGPQSREVIADLLWEAASTRQSLQRLRELLPRVQRWVPRLEVTRQTVGFRPNSGDHIDVLTLRNGLTSNDLDQVDAALQLYDGDLLTSFYLKGVSHFNEWLLLERERLRRQVIGAYRELCHAYETASGWKKGVAAARRWVAMDELNEEVHRTLIRLLASDGQTAAAMGAYDRCRQILWEELAAEPERATKELAQQIAELQLHKPVRVAPDRSLHEVLSADTLSSPGPLPSQALLPYLRNTDFVGREAQLLQVAKVLGRDSAQSRLPIVAISGIGGMGKTQTAVEFCYRYGRYFSGGVYWLSFAVTEDVAEEVARIGSERGMGLYRETDQLTLADQVGRVQRAWQEPIPRLLVFDNCEDEALLATWMPIAGGCHVLVTTRRGWWSRELGVTVCTLDGLNEAEAVALLQRLVPTVGAADSAEIAAELGYLPLALHLAGGFLRRYRQIAPRNYLAQLRDVGLLRHPSLQGRGSTHSPTGHELSVARTFAVHAQQLDSADATNQTAWRLLACMACFAPGEPVDQELLLQTVADEEDDLATILLAEDGLARLLALGFVQAESERTAVMHRLVHTFTHATVDDLSAAQADVERVIIGRLRSLLEDTRFRGALPLVTTHVHYVVESAFARSTRAVPPLALALSRHLREIGEFEAALRWTERGLAVARIEHDPYTTGRLLATLSHIHYSQGRNRLALRCAHEAETVLRACEPPPQMWLRKTLRRQGWASLILGEAETALAAAEAGHQLAVQSDNQSDISSCLNLLGSIHFFLLGEYDVAERYYEQALELDRQLGDRFSEATVVANLGQCVEAQGKYEQAAAHFETALAMMRQIGNTVRALVYQVNLAEMYVHFGDCDAAIGTLLNVTAQAPTDWTYAPFAYRVLAEAYLSQGNPAQALATVQRALQLLGEKNHNYDRGHVWQVLGLIAAQTDAPVQADPNSTTVYDPPACFSRSTDYFASAGLERDRAITLWRWAEVELAQGERVQGMQRRQEARDLFEHLNLPLFVDRMDAATSDYRP